MSRRARLSLARVGPGDIAFFGSAGLHGHATANSINHTGIALSRDCVIHSSAQGVYVLPLSSGWLNKPFAWARRLL